MQSVTLGYVRSPNDELQKRNVKQLIGPNMSIYEKCMVFAPIQTFPVLDKENMQQDNLLKGLPRETTIRRDASGRWFHEEAPIEHPNIVRVFNRWIDRAEDGRYCLKNDFDWVYITVEGAPLFVRSLKINTSGSILLSLSDERECALDPDTLRQGPDGVLYCDVRNRTMVARFDPSAMMQLEELIDEDEKGIYLLIDGRAIRPKTVANPLEFDCDET